MGKIGLWLVIERHNDAWDVVFTSEQMVEADARYQAIGSGRMLIHWSILQGIRIWRIHMEKTRWGDDIANPILGWDALPANDRVAIYPRIHAVVREFMKE